MFFTRYGISEITITTDCGSNILKAVEDYESIKCACHRLSTSINDAWGDCLIVSETLRALDSNCNTLMNSLSHSVDIQSKLPRKIKPGPRTRAWRGMIVKFESIAASHSKLCEILDPKRKKLIYLIDLELVKEVHSFLKKFEEIFDSLEKSCEPSINLVLPSYYSMVKMLQAEETDSTTTKIMKTEFLLSIKYKFFKSIKDIHFIASFLDSRYKNLKFLSENQKQLKIKMIQNSIIEFAKTFKKESKKKDSKEREQKKTSVQQFEDSSDDEDMILDTDVLLEIAKYKSSKQKTENPLEFWEINKTSYPIMSKYAEKKLIAQASSAISERIFTHAGKINSQERASMSAETIAASTRCKSAKLNNIF